MAVRRLSLANVQLEGRTWEEVRFELQRFLEALNSTQDDGVAPGGHSTQDPEAIALTPDPGDPTQGWSPGDHVHTADHNYVSGRADAGQHPATAISTTSCGGLTETEAQAALCGLESRKLAHTRAMIRVSIWR